MKECLVLKKSEYVTKDNKAVYRLHLWIDDGIIEYVCASVEKTVYDSVIAGSKKRFSYELNVYNGKIYGIKNVTLA